MTVAEVTADTILALGDGPEGNVRVADLFNAADALERTMREFLSAEREFLADRSDAKLRGLMQSAASADRALDDYRAFRARMRS